MHRAIPFGNTYGCQRQRSRRHGKDVPKLIDPIAAITGVNTASPATLYVHVDHLNRPVSMSNASNGIICWNGN